MDSTMRPEHRLYGLCLILAPLLLATATLFWDGPSVGLAGGVLTVYSFTCWIGVFLAFAARLRPRMPGVALAVASAGVLGSVAGTNFGVEGVVEGGLDIADVSEAVLLQAGLPENAAMVLAFFLPGALFPLTLLFSAAALMRAKAIPFWCGALLCLGAIAFPLSRIPRVQWVALMADMLLLLPMFWLGWQHLHTRAPWTHNTIPAESVQE